MDKVITIPKYGNYCSVFNCKNSSKVAQELGITIRFFTFPRNSTFKEQWAIKCCRSDQNFNPDHARICSVHFTPSDFQDEIRSKLMGYAPRVLKKDAIPSLLLPIPLSTLEPKDCITQPQFINIKERKKVIATFLNENEETQGTQNNLDMENNEIQMDRKQHCDAEITPSTSSDINVIKRRMRRMQHQINALQNQNKILKKNNEKLQERLANENEASKPLKRKLAIEKTANNALKRRLLDLESQMNLNQLKKEPQWIKDEYDIEEVFGPDSNILC